MLSYILGLMQLFERTHGRLPLLVCLNTQHMQRLLDECPGLADSNESVALGFRISILPEDALPHPKVSLLPIHAAEKYRIGRPESFSHQRPHGLTPRRPTTDSSAAILFPRLHPAAEAHAGAIPV